MEVPLFYLSSLHLSRSASLNAFSISNSSEKSMLISLSSKSTSQTILNIFPSLLTLWPDCSACLLKWALLILEKNRLHRCISTKGEDPRAGCLCSPLLFRPRLRPTRKGKYLYRADWEKPFAWGHHPSPLSLHLLFWLQGSSSWY